MTVVTEVQRAETTPPAPSGSQSPRPRLLSRIGQFVLVVTLTIVALELALHAALSIRTQYFSKSDRYLSIIGDAGRAQLYPGWSRTDLKQLLRETYVPVVYEPYTGFAERPRNGRFVNVAADGYRDGAEPQPWPIDQGVINVFVFGGSTTFGYGVTDAQTIPAAIQDSLAAVSCGPAYRVYNFGRGFYYSTQERALFERLITAGHRPNAAVFIDGLNDSDNAADVPPFADDFARLFAVRQRDAGVLGSLAVLTATGRVLRRAQGQLRQKQIDSNEIGAATGRKAAARWLENVRLTEAVARVSGVIPLFVVQPIRPYHFDFEAHPLAEQERRDPSVTAVRTFYDALGARRNTDATLKDVLWLADAHRGWQASRVFVDLGHYTPEFSAYLGGHIARELRPRLPAQCTS